MCEWVMSCVTVCACSAATLCSLHIRMHITSRSVLASSWWVDAAVLSFLSSLETKFWGLDRNFFSFQGVNPTHDHDGLSSEHPLWLAFEPLFSPYSIHSCHCQACTTFVFISDHFSLQIMSVFSTENVWSDEFVCPYFTRNFGWVLMCRFFSVHEPVDGYISPSLWR